MKQTFFFCALLFLVSCKNKTSDSLSDSAEEMVSSDFRSFYTKFISDSTFQMNHIDFPLDGMPNLSEMEFTDDFTWKKDEWVLHKELNDPHNEFITETQNLGKNLVIETIRHKNGTFQMVRRFAKTSDGWRLIYFQDLNIMQAEE